MGPNKKIFRKYTMASLVSMLGSSAYVLVDTMFVARIGSDALAALNLILPIYSILNSFAMFLAVGASTHYSFEKGKGNTKKGSVYFTHAIVLGMCVVILLTVLMFAFRRQTALLLGANAETLDYCIHYMNGYVPFAPFIGLQMIILAFTRNDGDPKLASRAALSGSLFNLVFDYVFIFTLNLGMFGAALATGLSPIVGLLVVSPYFLHEKNGFHLLKTRLSSEIFRQIAHLGLPIFIQEASSGIVMIAFNKQLLVYGGNAAVTAYGIIFNIAVVIQYCMSGIAQGTQPLISENYGRGHLQDIHDYTMMAVRTILIFAAAGLCMARFAGDQVISIFNAEHNQALQLMTKEGMDIYFIGLIGVGFNELISIFFTSTNHPLPSNIISIMKTGIIITPLVLVLPKFLGLKGVWISYPLAEMIILSVALSFFLKDPIIRRQQEPQSCINNG